MTRPKTSLVKIAEQTLAKAEGKKRKNQPGYVLSLAKDGRHYWKPLKSGVSRPDDDHAQMLHRLFSFGRGLKLTIPTPPDVGFG